MKRPPPALVHALCRMSGCHYTCGRSIVKIMTVMILTKRARIDLNGPARQPSKSGGIEDEGEVEMARANLRSKISAKDMEDLIATAIATQCPDADQDPMRAAANLKRAANILNQLEFVRLHPSTGRTPSAYRVLFMIWCFEPVEATEIGRLSAVSRQSVSAILSTLEKDGLVSRRRSEVDKRQAQITTTPAGTELVVENLLPQNEVQRNFFAPLSSEELQTFTDLLARVILAAHGQQTRIVNPRLSVTGPDGIATSTPNGKRAFIAPSK